MPVTSKQATQPGWERISSSEGDTDSTNTPSPDSYLQPDTSAAGEGSQEFTGSDTGSEMPWWHGQEDLVIAGIGCRFPRSDNMQEFGDLLLAKEDLVTEDDLRWPPGFYDLPPRHAKIKDLKKFDAQFFGIPPKHATYMDPQIRLLLETAYEAMIDAGINPMSLRGTRTGVFVGCSASETGGALTQDPDVVTGYTLTGCVRSMFSNRISYAFDLRGPSFSVDTACSSSLLALQLAIDAIRQDQCEAAIVGGSQVTLTPTSAIQFLRLGMLSMAGQCRSFDSQGEGYVRAEGVSCILIQKRSAAKRVYATVLHAKSNTDGFKEQGITFPSGERQAHLLEEVYREASIDPNQVCFVEAHGTGTKVGDPQEANAICETFCSNRSEQQLPLLIGAVKSNMGHAEPGSGLASVAKVLTAMHRGKIPPNLHYEEPNPYIPGLIDGRLQVVTDPADFKPGGLVGVNSFGFGGSNTHVVLKAHLPIEPPKEVVEDSKKVPYPRLALYPGRIADGVTNVLKSAEDHCEEPHFLALLANQANLLPKDAPFRGYSVMNRTGGAAPIKDVQKIPMTEQRPIYFIYSGMGSQWYGMAKGMMAIPMFRDSVIACSDAVRHTGYDPYNIMMSDNADVFKNNTLNCMLCITAVQIALTDMIRAMGVEPDGIIGHSTGEMGCSYCDGGTTREQTMMLAYHRGNCIMNEKSLMNIGGMAAVGLTWEEAIKRCPEGVVPACHNGKDSVTISGYTDKVKEVVDQLQKEEIFAKYVDSSGVPFHSPMMMAAHPAMMKAMGTVITEPKLRSSKWLSTSIPEAEWDSDKGRMCSAEYHVNNAVSPVLFYEALTKVPANGVTIEIAPHSLMAAVLRRSLPKSCSNVGLMNMKAENEVESFLQSLGKIYQAGVCIHPEILYPKVEYPVPLSTPMLNSLWRWDHSQDWPVIDGKHLAATSGGGGIPVASTYTIDPYVSDSKEAFILDHVVDGRCLYPFTGHMVLAWKSFCKLKGCDFNKTPVIMENINVYRPTIITKAFKLDVIVTPGTGTFEILDGDQLAASGKITVVEDDRPFFYNDISKIETSTTADRIELDTEDAYKEFLLRGYEYGQAFRGIYKTCNSGERGTLYWTGNWVTFLDSLLQTALLAERADTLRLPVRVRYMRIDPIKHLECIEERDGIQVIELRNDISTNGCVAGGVECCDLTAQTVPRRLHATGRIYMERIFFAKHYDDNCLDEFPSERRQHEIYRQLVRSVLANGWKKWNDAGILPKLTNGPLFVEALKALKGANNQIDEQSLQKHMEDSRCPLVTALHELFALDVGSGADVAEFEKKGVDVMKTADSSMDNDKLWASGLATDRIIKSIEDLCVENSAGHKFRFCAVELHTIDALKYCVEALSSHPLLEMEWVCAGPKVDQLDDNSISQIGARKLVLDLDGGQQPKEDNKNFDILLLDKVLSRKTDIPRYMEKLKELMRDDGFAMVVEVTKDFEIGLATTGLLGQRLEAGDGARQLGRFLTHEQWLKIFAEAGFTLSAYHSDPSVINTMYLIRKIPQQPADPVFVDVDDIQNFTWIEPLQKYIEERLNEPDYKTIWLTNTKVRDNGVLGLALCLCEENLKSNRFRTIIDLSNDKKAREGPATIGMESPDVKDLIIRNLHANNYRDGHWGSMRHFVVKDEEQHQFKDTEHAFINTLVRGDLASLTWVESPNQFFEATNAKANRQLCSVYYAAINFRDVMLATGRLPPDAIPGNFADRDCLLGMEFAGRLSSGKRVMGILPAQALATTVVVDTDYSWEVPDNWSLADAATVPVVYTTAYYALIMRGRMRRGDKVLIHSGSGGVGQAAIAIALANGCEVFTTVGSEEKRNFLKKRFPQLQEKHFSNSRTTEFEWHIRQVTKGQGVDIILNSLAEEKLQASLRCLATHGRFLEIGKFDLSNNSSLGMALFLKNVTFHGILLDALMDTSIGNMDDWTECSRLFQEGLKNGIVQPLSYTTFSSEKPEEAFRYMATGKHVGKVLMEIRGEESSRSAVPTPIRVRAVCRTLCNPRHVYLITGGLGGFGLELAQWLITRGARRLVLTSRSGIRSGYQARCVHFWRRTGVSVLVSTLNISEMSEARRLIDQCREMGPVGGVFHLAMVLRDCLFENQNVQNFKDAAEAKYWGSKHLDLATRELCDNNLRWFVVFSSITAGRGNAGQTNYGWSNSTMERIVEHRRSDGYPGIAIQWGAIGDVGVIIENMGDNNTVVGGTLPQRMPSCLTALDMFLSWNHPIVSTYIRADTGNKKAAGGGNLLQTIAHILGVNDVSQLNPDANLGDLGLDSLMGVEIKQALERDYDIVLSMKDIRTLTLNKLQQMAETGGASVALTQGELDLKREGEKEAEQKTAEQLEKQMNQLFKMRIDVNDLDPQGLCVKVNDVDDGAPAFFVHSIEGIATPIRRVTKKCTFPAYCFQATRDSPFDSIEHVAATYIKEMKKHQPTGPYRIIGYSYGACIGFEMACILQETEGVDAVEKLILLDGSHHYMQTYRNVYRLAFGVTGDSLVNNPLFESEIMCALGLRFANVDYKKFRVELLQQPGFKGRVQKVVDTVMQTGLFKSGETVAFACNAMRAKFLMADKYKPTHKFQGKITLIRAEQGAAREEDVGRDYGVGEVADEVDVFMVEGDHDTFVQGKSSAKTADIINNIIAGSK